MAKTQAAEDALDEEFELYDLRVEAVFFDADVAEDDVVREFGTVKVVVDQTSADLLKGSTLDYSDGLQGAGFHVTNPNATRTCGCGSSFS